MQKVNSELVIDEYDCKIIDADVVMCIRWPNGHLDDFAFKLGHDVESNTGWPNVYAEFIIESDPKFEDFKCKHISPTNGSGYWTPNISIEYLIMQPEDYVTVSPEATFIYEGKCIRVGHMGTCIALRDGLGIQPFFEDLGNGEFKFIGLPDPWVNEEG